MRSSASTKGVDTANRIVLFDPILEALRQKRRLRPICAFHEPLHDHPRRIIKGIMTMTVFSHTQVIDVARQPLGGREAEIPGIEISPSYGAAELRDK